MPENLVPSELPAIEPEEDLINPDLNEANPAALINLLPHFMKQKARKLKKELLDMPEDELVKKIWPDGVMDSCMYRLRIAFWDEYDRTLRHREQIMDSYRVYAGVCSGSTFVKIADQPYKLALLLHPPADYTLLLKEITEIALRRQLEVVKMGVLNEKGQPNVKLIEAQIKIFQHVDLRLRGAPTQKIEQKNLNVNVDGKQAQTKPALSLPEIDAEIQKLRKLSEQLQSPASVKIDHRKLVTGETIEAEFKPNEPGASEDVSATKAAEEVP